jgi:hypothetical protein
VRFSERARAIASLIGSGVWRKGSPPSNWKTCCPEARSSMTLLRMLTMSEKPTFSSREARRKAEVDVDTMVGEPPTVSGELTANYIPATVGASNHD